MRKDYFRRLGLLTKRSSVIPFDRERCPLLLRNYKYYKPKMGKKKKLTGLVGGILKGVCGGQ